MHLSSCSVALQAAAFTPLLTGAQLAGYCQARLALSGFLLQLRIGAIVRRDSEAEHPSFPGEIYLLDAAAANRCCC